MRWVIGVDLEGFGRRSGGKYNQNTLYVMYDILKELIIELY